MGAKMITVTVINNVGRGSTQTLASPATGLDALEAAGVSYSPGSGNTFLVDGHPKHVNDFLPDHCVVSYTSTDTSN